MVMPVFGPSLQRKKSLLQEYKQRGKTNAFLDHRFGENDESLGDEDKAILRFQKERMVFHFAFLTHVHTALHPNLELGFFSPYSTHSSLVFVEVRMCLYPLERCPVFCVPGFMALIFGLGSAFTTIFCCLLQVQMQKKSKFTLEDDDDDDEEPTELLTHGGNALSSFDDFKDDISIEEDDDDDAGCMAIYLYV